MQGRRTPAACPISKISICTLACNVSQSQGQTTFRAHVDQPSITDARHTLLPQVANASEYGGILLDGGITLGVAQRRAMIWSAITDVARYFGGYVPDACRQDLLPEVANLVEAPTVVAGSFSSSFLSIPG